MLRQLILPEQRNMAVVLFIRLTLVDAIHRLRALICPVGNTSCLNSSSDFMERICNTEYLCIPTKIDSIKFFMFTPAFGEANRGPFRFR